MLGLWRLKKCGPTYQTGIWSPCKFASLWLWLSSALAHRQKKNCMEFADFSVLDAGNYTLTHVYPDPCKEPISAQDYLKLHQSFLKAM